jgi:membrane protein
MAESQLETKEQVSTIWHLGGLTPKELGKRVWHEINHDDIFGYASQLAYNFTLALFPLLLFLLALLGVLATRGTEIRQMLFSGLQSVLPPDAWNLVNRTIAEVVKNSGGGKLTIGLVFSVWAASSGVSAMMSALNAAYDIHDSRPYYRTKLIAIGLTVTMSILIVLACTIVLFGGHIADAAGNVIGLGNAAVLAWKIIQWPIAFFFVSLAFAVVYYYGPDVKEQHWYWITPGSIMGVLLWFLVTYAFRVYLRFYNTYSRTYGSLGAMIILLVWFYVTGLSFVVGGEINSEIEHAAAEHGHPEAKAEGEKAA